MKTFLPINEETWLVHRKNFVTASDAAAICGHDPRRTPFAVWLRKVGDDIDKFDANMRAILDWGKFLERDVFEFAISRLGLNARYNEKNIVCISDDYPWLSCTPDGFCHNEPVEVKTTSQPGDWRESIPTRIRYQVETQMIVFGAKHCHLVYSQFGRPPEYIMVDRDDKISEEIIEKTEKFWECVKTGEPPEVSGDDIPEINEMSGLDPEKAVDLGWSAVALTDKVRELEAQAKELEKEAKQLRAELAIMIGDAEVGHLPDGRAWRRSKVERAGYAVAPKSYYQMRLMTPKE